jgi:hypothetical protein
MLLIYVIAGNGFNTQSSLSSSFHGATFQTKEDCETAARTVSSFATPPTADFTKYGIIMVCAPVDPPPVTPAPSPKEVTPAPAPEPLFPPYPPPKRGTH